MEILRYQMPAAAREQARGFLSQDPVRNTFALTILEQRITDSQPGRYWVAVEHSLVVGLALQAPVDRPLVLSVMSLEAAGKLANAIAADGVELTGVSGEVHVASRFAGEWAACRRVAVSPVAARRLYEARSVRDGAIAQGALEAATAAHAGPAHDWHTAFLTEIGESTQNGSDFVPRRIAAGLLWFWADHGFRSIAAASPPVLGTTRLQCVYTPPQYRRTGYAEALVRTVTRQLLGETLRVMLIADLGDPMANGIYQRVGYEAAAEMIRYRFRPGTRGKS